MSLYETIKHIYPDLEDDKFIIKDDGDGPYILGWLTDLPRPTEEEVNSIGADVELNATKFRKLGELNKECSKTILGKFSASVDGVKYYFSNDMEAQANFEKADKFFSRGMLTVQTWTAYNENMEVVRIDLDITDFEYVYMSHVSFIQYNIARFRDELMPLVVNATSVQEVNSITWDMVIEEEPVVEEPTEPTPEEPTTEGEVAV